jgi:hypothetical protein
MMQDQSMETELATQCEALIFAIRQLVASDKGQYEQRALIALRVANEAEDFIVNHCGD